MSRLAVAQLSDSMLSACQATCPLHVLPELVSKGKCKKPFRGISAQAALGALREMAGLVGIVGHDRLRTHDLRRGHAKDLQLSGETFVGIDSLVRRLPHLPRGAAV